MHLRNAAGRRISILNDDDDIHTNTPSNNNSNGRPHPLSGQPYYAPTPGTGSAPNTPELLRSDSYDSHMSAEPISPVTPLYEPGPRYAPTPVYAAPSTYDDYYADHGFHLGTKRRPSTQSDGRSVSHEDELAARAPATASTAGGERPAKRFPCRYRDTHGCHKTFTTSGHASRHSKIHTAEKSVPCTFAGCNKKFTRSDNMKQHLETHYKDKSRPAASSSSRPSLAAAVSGGHERRTSSSSSSCSAAAAAKASRGGKAARHTVAVELHPAAPSPITPLPSPSVGGTGGIWDMRAIDVPLLPRPTVVRGPASGLDALVMAAACRERQ